MKIESIRPEKQQTKELKASIVKVKEGIEQARLEGNTKQMKLLKIVLKRLESLEK